MLQAFCIVVLFYTYVCSTSAHSYYDEEGWKNAGDFVKKYINPDKSPCDEFYEHVCGKYGDKNGTIIQNSLNDAMTMIREITLKAILQIDLKSNATTTSEESVRWFYDECVAAQTGKEAWKSLDEAISSRINRHLQESDEFNPWRFLAFVKKEMGVDVGFVLETSPLIPRKGANYALEPVVSPDQKAPMAREDKSAKRVLLHDLPVIIPSIDWVSYFDELWPRDLKDKVKVVIDVYHFGRIEAIAREINTMDVENLTARVNETIFRNTLSHYLRQQSPTELCLLSAMRHLSPAVANLYFNAIGQDILEWRQDIVTLSRNIFSAFRFLLNNVDWMNVHDKELIQKKVDDMFFYPGIPTWIGDEKEVERETARYVYAPNASVFENEFRFSKVYLDRELRNEYSNEIEDASPKFEANAFYSPRNGIFFYLGFVAPPYYHINYPLAVKYGSLGYVMGHELMHAFDSDRVFESPHPDDQWLSANSLEKFKQQTTCLVKQYSRYCFPDKGKCLDGQLTLTENIADIDGLKVAFAAYKFLTQVFDASPPIPSMLKYTQDQTFFLTNARVWCSKGWHDLLLQDEHTPHKPRIDVMMRNVNLFARAFNCTTGSTYAPLKTCSIWGDLSNPHKKR